MRRGGETMTLCVGVMGAGSIGCFVGGSLASGGVDVVLVGRERLRTELETSGLTLFDLDGPAGRVVPKERVRFTTELSALTGCNVVLCCVKSTQTADTAEQLAPFLAKDTLVVSMQNGVRNADALRVGLPAQTVLGGIVGFNVLSKGRGVFRRATSGPLVIEASADARVGTLAGALRAAGFQVEVVADIRPLQYAKLVMNLNNAVSALTGRPTMELLFAKEYRRILAAIMDEAVAVLRLSKTRTARLGALPVPLFPFVLRLPTPLLRLVASAQVKIDPEARSSMWEDLSRGRLTEVDHLNGEIVRLATSCGARAPLNTRVVEMVHAVEKRGSGSPQLDAATFWAQLTAT